MKCEQIVGGVSRPTGQRRVVTPTGEELFLAELGADEADDVLATTATNPLVDVPTDVIIAFLHNVGKNWKSHEYARRRLYIRHLCRYLGYSEREATVEADWLALTLCSHFRMHSLLEAELGDRYALDRWVPHYESEVRAWPRGRVLHYLAGNLPVVAITSILRGILTKNVNIVKVPSGDPITSLALAASFADVDPDHPVSRSLSILWWESGKSQAGLEITRGVDTVVAWGGEDAMRWVASAAGPETDVTWFGPRRSMALIDATDDAREAARRLAHDVAFYQQRACFNVHQAFVVGDVPNFSKLVGEQLAAYADLLPTSSPTIDEAAAQSMALLEARFAGVTVREPPGDREWAIVEAAHADSMAPHPLGRTLYLSEQASVSELPELGERVQTVALYPFDRASAVRDTLARTGVHRVVELGMTNLFRVGSTHDSVYPLTRLVRIVSCDLPSAMHASGVTTPIDQLRILEDDSLYELIP
jgi:long-chain-fatty-acyl-CoA reductase